MDNSLTMRNARPWEAGELGELAIRSKAYWGYSKEFIDACREELAITSQRIDSDQLYYVVAEEESTVLGFYAIERLSDCEYELEALFVEPEFIRRGIGEALLAHAKETARASGCTKLMIQGDPNATEFYLAAGGKPIGSRASASISGRSLPLFVIDLAVR